jgi:PAS domain-containing protein
MLLWIRLSGRERRRNRSIEAVRDLQDRFLEGDEIEDDEIRALESSMEGTCADLVGGIADSIARERSSTYRIEEAEARFRTLFDELPLPAYLRSTDGRVTAANTHLLDEIDRREEDLAGKSEQVLERIMPVERIAALLARRGFCSRGIRRLLIPPANSRLTIIPVRYRGSDAHVVMLDLAEETVHGVDGDGPETPRGLGMAVNVSELNGSIRLSEEGQGLIARSEIGSGLADLYGATDLAVFAIDEEGRTLHWSKAARRFTGLWKRDIPDTDAFCRLVLIDEVQRATFERWLQGDPTRLSRQLVCRLEGGAAAGLTWHADETVVRTRPGETRRVTVLWCKTPVFELR